MSPCFLPPIRTNHNRISELYHFSIICLIKRFYPCSFDRCKIIKRHIYWNIIKRYKHNTQIWPVPSNKTVMKTLTITSDREKQIHQCDYHIWISKHTKKKLSRNIITTIQLPNSISNWTIKKMNLCMLFQLDQILLDVLSSSFPLNPVCMKLGFYNQSLYG